MVTQEEKLEIAKMTAQLLMAQIQEMQNAYLEMMNHTREVFIKHPELRGKNKELGDIVQRLATANPQLGTAQMFETAAQELIRNAD